MAQKTKKLEEEVLIKLRELQSKINENIRLVGEVTIRNRELELELNRISDLKDKFLKDYDEAVSAIQNEVKILEKDYPKGEIDLVEGVVIYQSEE